MLKVAILSLTEALVLLTVPSVTKVTLTVPRTGSQNDHTAKHNVGRKSESV